MGGRFHRGVFTISPAIGVGLNGEAGTPRLRGLVSLSIHQPPPPKPVPPPEPLPPQVVSLPDSVFANLDQVATLLSHHSQSTIRVEIHTVEEDAARASALEKVVLGYLGDKGISPDRMEVNPQGATGSEWIDIIIVSMGPTPP